MRGDSISPLKNHSINTVLARKLVAELAGLICVMRVRISACLLNGVHLQEVLLLLVIESSSSSPWFGVHVLSVGLRCWITSIGSMQVLKNPYIQTNKQTKTLSREINRDQQEMLGYAIYVLCYAERLRWKVHICSLLVRRMTTKSH